MRPKLFLSGHLTANMDTCLDGNCKLQRHSSSCTMTRFANKMHKINPYHEDSRYARFRAIGCGCVDGANGNHDFFPYTEFEDDSPGFGHKTFVHKRAHIEHNSDRGIAGAIGVLEDSVLNRFNLPSGFQTFASVPMIASDRYPRLDVVNAPGQKDGSIEVLMRIDSSLIDQPFVNSDIKRAIQATIHALDTGQTIGCFTGNTPVLMADYTYKPIEQVKQGDEVITHQGRVKKVKRTFIRDVEEVIYKIKVQGIVEPFLVTKEHPIEIIAEAEYKGDLNTYREFSVTNTLFRTVDNLKTGDLAMTPKLNVERTEPSVSKEFARLLGYYLAEGSLAHWTNKAGERYPLAVLFSFNNLGPDDEYIKEVKDLIRKEFNTEPKIYNTEGYSCTDICIRSKEAAQKFYEWGRKGAFSKKMLDEVFTWPKEYQLALIGAYINGDGHQQVNKNNQSSSISTITVSKQLAYQIHMLLWMNDIASTVYSFKASLSGNDVYAVFVRSSFQDKLVKYADVVKNPFNSKKGRKVKRNVHGFGRPITSIDEIKYSGPVYNFEVEDDNSYIVNGLSVHNCSMGTNLQFSVCSACGNKAATEDDYCSDIAYNKGGIRLVQANQLRDLIAKGRLRPEWMSGILGRPSDVKEVLYGSGNRNVVAKVIEINHKLSFFELSIVGAPAYHKGYGLETISNDVAAMRAYATHLHNSVNWSKFNNNELLSVYAFINQETHVHALA